MRNGFEGVVSHRYKKYSKGPREKKLSLQKVLKFLGFGEDICSFMIVCVACHGRAEKHCIEFGDLASGLDWDSLSDTVK